jgi:hypothetical protein
MQQPFQTSDEAFKGTTEEWRSVAAKHNVSKKAAQHRLAPSSSRGASLDVAIQDAEEGTKGHKKRRKQCCQETTTTNDDYGGINKQAGSSIVGHALAATGSSKHQVRSLTDHFEKLLEESCQNHAYLVKHRLRDSSMMKSLRTSGSLS